MELVKHSWKTVRSYIKKQCPQLASIIDNLSPPADHSFYTAKYPYGAMILDKGISRSPILKT